MQQMNTPKLLLYFLLLLLFTHTTMVSCSKDEAFIDLVGLDEDKDGTDQDGNGSENPDQGGEDPDPGNGDDGSQDGNNGTDFDSSEGLKISTTPCDFTLNGVEANATVEIDCRMDLGGQTITLPAGIALTFKGGEIINGTLNFSGQGVIDGNLLNKSLNVEGDVKLNNTEFQFYPERWDIVQGEVTSDRALKNNANLENLMYYVKDLGATTFQIDEFDAYFEVTKVTSTTTNQNFYPSVEAVNIPSDFTLSMTDKTTLRVYPTENLRSAALLAVRESENVKIIGGVLYGDRDLRHYSDENAESGAHLITIRSGKNVTLDGIKITKGSIGGVTINSEGHSFESIYNPSNNIVIRSCVFDNNRSMSISVTDGNNIDINGNTFLNSGMPTPNSDGGVVGYAINLEPVRTRNSQTNELIEYQKVYDVVIRNNRESQSDKGAVIVFIGQNIIVENNDFEGTVAYTLASDTHIRNNTFKASARSSEKPALIVGGQGETVFNNKVTGNTIEGYGLGIAAYYKDIEIDGNIINNCNSGIQFKEGEDILIQNNKITNLNSGRGISGQITTAKNIEIRNNEINVKSNSIYFVQLNNDSSTSNLVQVLDNNFFGSGTSVVSSSSGVVYKGNITEGGVEIINASNTEISNNSISPAARHGVHLRGSSSNINVNNNIIDVTSNYDCIRNDSTGSVATSNNTCQ